MAYYPDVCTHCAQHVGTCERLLADCGHLLNPEQYDDPPCEQCDRCQDCCQCSDNEFKAALPGE
jgi:hypothetical protein